MEKKYIWIIVGVIGASLITVLGISIPILMVPPSKDEWLTCTPEEVGMNSSKIEEMYDYIYENSINMHSVLIIRNGCIVDQNFLENYIRREENYYAPSYMVSGGRHRVYSCTKSIISLLIGIAIEMGYIDSINQTLYEFLEDYWKPSYDVRKKNITIRHLLMQTSGFGGLGPYSEPYIEESLDEPLSFDPGTDWLYCGTGCNLLSAIISITTGMKTSEFAREYLFEPIGISQEDWEWVEDYQLIANGANGLSFTPRAMAKIGIMCLNNGSWEGNQVVPKEWINESTSTVSGFYEEWRGGGGFGEDYGYLWWLMPGYYLSTGAYGQCIVVIPEYDIVVIFTASYSDYFAPYIYIINSFIIGGII